MKKFLILAALALSAGAAWPGELLLHGLSQHARAGYEENGRFHHYNNLNLGLGYLSETGWVAGLYHNSYDRVTIYLGRNWSLPVGPAIFGRQPDIGLTLVLATGYQHRTSLFLSPLAGFTYKVPLSTRWSAVLTVAPVPYEQKDRSWSLGAIGNLSLAYRL